MWRVLVLAAAVACGGSNGPVKQKTLDRTCEVTCSRFDECGTFESFGGFTYDTCLEQCEGQQETAFPEDCDVTDGEARACLDAWEASSCDALEGGETPSECDLCVPPSPVTPPPPTPVTCDDLAECCAAIADPDTAEGCYTIANSAGDGLCAQTLMGFQIGGLCP